MTENSSGKPAVDQSRRKTLKFLVAGAAAVAATGIGGYAWESSQNPPVSQTTSATSSTPTSAPTMTGTSGKTLHILEWAGYDVEDLWKPFKEQHPDVNVQFSIAADELEMLAKLQGGFEADLVHPCVDTAKLFVDAGLLEPIDTSLIPNWSNLGDKFKNAVGVHEDGNVVIAPLDWSFESITYRPDLVSGKPDSWQLLWDKQYKGKLSMMDGYISVVVTAFGLRDQLGIQNVWNMADQELDKVKQKLIDQKPLIRTYWSTSTDLVPLMTSGDVVAAFSWADAAAGLYSKSIPAVYMNPKEGRLGWICGLSVVKGTKNRDLAHDYINAWMDASTGKWLMENYWYGHSNQNAMNTVDPSLLKFLGVDDPAIMQNTTFFQHIPNLAKYGEVWNEVKAA